MKTSLKLRWSDFNSCHLSLCFSCIFFHFLRRKTGVFTQTCHCKLEKIFKHPYCQWSLTCWLCKKKKKKSRSERWYFQLHWTNKSDSCGHEWYPMTRWHYRLKPRFCIIVCHDIFFENICKLNWGYQRSSLNQQLKSRDFFFYFRYCPLFSLLFLPSAAFCPPLSSFFLHWL